MIYAKIKSEHEAVCFSGRVLRDEDTVIANPTAKTLTERGFFPLREIEEPKQKPGFRSLPRYRLEGGEVLLSYDLIRETEAAV